LVFVKPYGFVSRIGLDGTEIEKKYAHVIWTLFWIFAGLLTWRFIIFFRIETTDVKNVKYSPDFVYLTIQRNDKELVRWSDRPYDSGQRTLTVYWTNRSLWIPWMAANSVRHARIHPKSKIRFLAFIGPTWWTLSSSRAMGWSYTAFVLGFLPRPWRSLPYP
jgi:hypothetical protein